MKITMMEKVYRDSQYGLYVNGLRGTIATESSLDAAVSVLKKIGYIIKEVNYVASTVRDDVPNNEFTYSPGCSAHCSLKLSSEKWIYHCKRSGCYDAGRNIYVNGELVSVDGNVEVLSELLSLMGHEVEVEYRAEVLAEATGECLGCQFSLAN